MARHAISMRDWPFCAKRARARLGRGKRMLRIVEDLLRE